MLLITADVTFQEHDENGKPYDRTNRGKPLKYESYTRNLCNIPYRKGTIHQDQDDGLLYVTKVAIDKNFDIIAIGKVITSGGNGIDKLVHMTLFLEGILKK